MTLVAALFVGSGYFLLLDHLDLGDALLFTVLHHGVRDELERQ